LGRWRFWLPLWLAALILLTLLGLVRRFPQLEMQLPLCAGRTEYVLYGPVAMFLLCLPALKVERRLTRWAAYLLALVVSFEYSLAPFLGPALVGPQPAVVDPQGICIQTDSYSCGPAASVTALKRLGVEADFFQLAGEAHTSQAIGTPPDLLCAAISKLYPVKAEYRFFETLPPLAKDQQLVLVLKLGLFVDHYVALLEAGEVIVVGDPLNGRQELSQSQFAERWRHTGILLTSFKSP